MINENTIWGSKQNHPELVVQDCVKEFSLNKDQEEKMRFILMNRGINKWLLARRRFIKLKHEVKAMMKQRIAEQGHKTEHVRDIKKIQATMQQIAKMPRWVEWGKHIHKKMESNEADIIIKGKRC